MCVCVCVRVCVRACAFVCACVCACALQDGVCQVFLDKGHVVVRAGNSEVRSQTALNDNNSHYVALYSNSNG